MPDSNRMGDLLGQGNTAEIFAWDEDKIVKLYRSEMPDDFCVYEFQVAQYAYEQLKIAPKPIEIVRIDSRIGAVYERISGKTMLKLMIEKPWRMRRYSKKLAQYHIALQQPLHITVTDVKDKLKKEIESGLLLSANEKNLIYKYLEDLPDGNIFCHFDFHPDNIMLFSGQYCVIDWMTGCVGDPLSDIARTSLILDYAEIPRVPLVINIFAGMVQKNIKKIYLREYIKLTGISASDIYKWYLPLAAARLCEWIPDRESRKLVALVKKQLKFMSI